MALLRRDFLRFVGCAAMLPTALRVARAEAYPSRPARIIVGFAPGGPADMLARLTGEWLATRLGQPFVVENRLGAGSNIAAEAVVHAPADGYTLLLVANPQAINASLYEKLSFNFIRDMAPVAGLERDPFVMLVQPSCPAKSVPEFVDYAKANSEKLSMASAGNGTASHVSGELFKMMAGVDLVHVPYRGGAPALTDLMGGRVQVSFLPLAGAIQHIRAGTVRALAVTSVDRSDRLPDVPTIAEFLAGYESNAWFGVAAPGGTPADVVAMLNREINAALAETKIKTRISDVGGTVLPLSPPGFGRLVKDETDKWARVIKFAGLKPS